MNALPSPRNPGFIKCTNHLDEFETILTVCEIMNLTPGQYLAELQRAVPIAVLVEIVERVPEPLVARLDVRKLAERGCLPASLHLSKESDQLVIRIIVLEVPL